MKTTLDKLKINEEAVIDEVNINNDIRRRLLDLGLIKNTKIKPLFKSPFNDPTAFLIRNSIFALRNDDCKNIKVITGDKDGSN